MQANHTRNQNRKAAEVLLKGLESNFVPVLELRIRTALTISQEKFGNQSKANVQSKKYSTLRTLYLELVSSVAEDTNKTHQVHLTFEVVGPACQNIAGNHHIRGQKKIAFSYSDPGGTLEKIKQPKTLI